MRNTIQSPPHSKQERSINTSSTSRATKESVLAIAVFSLITMIMLYPVSLNPGAMVIGRPFEDAFEYVWYLEWYQRALLDLRVSPLFQPDIFYPTGWNLGFSAFPPLYPALLAPLTAIAGAVTAYNLAIMGTSVFAAFGAYLLARRVGANKWGAILAGIAFAFYPQREVYLAGHLNFLTGSMWLPWALYAVAQILPRNVDAVQSRLRWAAFAGLAFALAIAGSWHFVFIATVALATFGLVFALQGERQQWRAWLKPLLVAALTFVVIIGPFLVYAAIVHSSLQEGLRFTFQDTNASSVSLERFFVPSAINPLFWDLARNTFPLTNGINGVVNFGYTAVLLGAVALWRGRPWSRSQWALASVIVAGLLLMPGLTLHAGGETLSMNLPVPPVLRTAFPRLFQPDGSLLLPMPAFFLYKFAPPFRTFHAFGRWGLIAAAALAPLAGRGLTLLQERLATRKQRTLFGVAALFLILLEFNLQPLPDVTRIDAIQREVDAWLSSQSEQSVIIEYPLDYAMKGQTLYYTTQHGQKIVHGAGSIFPLAYTERLPVLSQWPSPATLDLLQELGVQYVLVNVYHGDNQFESVTLPTLTDIDRLHLVRRFEENVGPIRDIYVFELQVQDAG